MVDEVQVKSSGYEAEYAGSVGGVVNVITKSGTNDFKGSAWTYYSSDGLGFARGPAFGAAGNQAPAYADGRPTLRLNPTDSNIGEHITYPKDSVTAWEPGFALGGPISKDKAWFFVSYNPTLRSIDRTVALTGGRGDVTRNEDRKTHYISANVSSQVSDALRARVAFNSNKQHIKGLLPALSGNDATGANYAIDTISPNYSGSANLDYIVSPKFFLSARAGYFLQNTINEGVPVTDRFTYQSSNIGGCNGCPTVPAQFQGPTGFTNVPTISSSDRDKFTRMSLQTDATWFVELGGKVLGGMVKRIAPDAKVTSVVTIEDVEALAKEIH